MRFFLLLKRLLGGLSYGLIGSYLGAAYLGAGHGTAIFFYLFFGYYGLALMLWPVLFIIPLRAAKKYLIGAAQTLLIAHYLSVIFFCFKEIKLIGHLFQLSPIRAAGITLLFALGQIYIWNGIFTKQKSLASQ